MTTTAITRHVLPGLQPEPLASYLAGLGLFRVLGEQADEHATAAWTSGGLVIATAVPDIARWLADEYRPMPVLSPWNGGSGFGSKDKEPLRRLDILRANSSPRLAGLRAAIEVAEDVIRKAREVGWVTGSGVADKNKVVLEFRNRCPDDLLPWIDAAIVLAGDDTFFPPILGTGGNDGRLEFSTNFHQQLIELVGATSAKGRARSLAAARDLLDGTQATPLSDVPIGQFHPGNAGGPGSSRLGAAASLANPWSYVLVVEGAVLFAASAARKNQHGAGRAAMPFTVNQSPDGSASGAAGEESRGEVWAPLWHQDCTLAEIKQLFTEARASWRGRPARKAIDFYAATRTLGVARGINQFTRYGLQRRNGLAFAAIPLDRVTVSERPAVQLSARVEDWATRVSGGEGSTAVTGAARAFQKAHLEFARDGRALTLAAMLAALTTLEMTVGRSGRAKGAVPVRHTPGAAPFLDALAEISAPEFRVAVGIASCATWPSEGPGRTMRQILLPVDPAAGWRDSPLVPGFGSRPLVDVLADVLTWRCRTASAEHNAARFRGVPTFPSGIGVSAADLHALANGHLDDTRLEFFLRACLALNWRNVKPGWRAVRPEVPVTTLALLHPLAVGLRPSNGRGEPDDEPIPALRPEWSTLLASGQPAQVRRVHDEAAALLARAVGWMAVPAPPIHATSDGTGIAAALVPRCLAPKAVLRMIAFDTNHQPEQPAQPEEQ
ncbi:MAG: type I-G CRISPR-associated protein Cas8g1/Csx17 [Trebonia sp.]